MIYEYALEPEMVAAWGDRSNYRFFIREFGLGQGRLVSRYPKKWAKKVWESFVPSSDMNKKRLTELLVRMQETMIKRKDFVWDDNRGSWLENALLEHARHPFKLIIARNNPGNRSEILVEHALDDAPFCPGWDIPHGDNVKRNVPEMSAAIKPMLGRCRWVKFIDPHTSPGRHDYRQSLRAFLKILAEKRPVGPPEFVEIHVGLHDGTAEFLRKSYEEIIPAGLKVTLFQWQEKPDCQQFHNRYILTDLGGISFHHGLDTSGNRTTFDDINRLALDQYKLHCKQYDSTAPAFDRAADPLEIVGTLGG